MQICFIVNYFRARIVLRSFLSYDSYQLNKRAFCVFLNVYYVFHVTFICLLPRTGISMSFRQWSNIFLADQNLERQRWFFADQKQFPADHWSLIEGRGSRVEGHKSRVLGHRSRVESRGSKVEVEGQKSRSRVKSRGSKVENTKFLSILKVNH
jgi:hypothetical protein